MYRPITAPCHEPRGKASSRQDGGNGPSGWISLVGHVKGVPTSATH